MTKTVQKDGFLAGEEIKLLENNIFPFLSDSSDFEVLLGAIKAIRNLGVLLDFSFVFRDLTNSKVKLGNKVRP